MSTKLIEGEHC